jgi:hypothetical protein
MFAESDETTAILPRVMRIVHQKAFQTPQFGLTGVGIWIIQMIARTAGKQTINPIWNWTNAVRIQKPRSSGMSVPHRISPD